MRSYSSYIAGSDIPSEAWVYTVRSSALLDDFMPNLRLKRELERGTRSDGESFPAVAARCALTSDTPPPGGARTSEGGGAAVGRVPARHPDAARRAGSRGGAAAARGLHRGPDRRGTPAAVGRVGDRRRPAGHLARRRSSCGAGRCTRSTGSARVGWCWCASPTGLWCSARRRTPPRPTRCSASRPWWRATRWW